MLDGDCIALFRQVLDIGQTAAIPATLDQVDPEAVINCAAYTKVDQAEDEEELATTVNGTAVGILAEWCARRGRPLLTFSTDYVFDGQSDTPYLESSPTDPVNAYGRSKLVGEQTAVGSGALVVRTSWVISGSHQNFVATMLRLAGEGKNLRVVDDQFGCPTIARDLAVTSHQALRTGAQGLLHVTNQGPTTWFQLARAAVDLAGLDPALVTPCPTDAYPTKARRPAYSVLASERAAGLGVELPPHWETSLPDVVSEIRTWL
ncbi:MAG: dTDP-4-dehydrorhamnose reductase [Acidimicrobiia bacterium]